MISVCIPMYNESKIVVDTAKTLAADVSEIADILSEDYEIIFADDGSTDGCGELLQSYISQNPTQSIRLVGYTENHGKGRAIREAVLASRGDYVIYTDCDLAYGTEPILTAVRTLSDADAVIGSRNLTKDGYEGYTFVRKLASKTYISVLSVAAGFSYSDSQCGFKAFRGEAARTIFKLCETDRFAFDFEVLMLAQKLGFSISEIPVKIINHRDSTVHIVRDSVKMLSDITKIKKRVKHLELESAK